MIRARKQSTARPHSEDDSMGNGSGRMSSSSRRMHESASKDLVSNTTLAIIVATIFGLGFLCEHYQSSRGRGSLPHKSVGFDFETVGGIPGASLIPPEEDAQLVQDTDGQVYHVIFSTDCGTYQHWQSYMTFYRAMKVKQPGYVTRIASGCTPEEKKVIEDWFDDHIVHMSDRFRLLLTPHFSQVKDEEGNVVGDYKFFNKPHGLKFWLEHSDLLDYNGKGKFPKTNDHIVILIDPDMSLLRPITKDFTSDEDTIIAQSRRDHIIGRTVEHGKPFAQTYGFGSQFLKLDMKEIGGPESRLLHTTHEEGRLYFPVGPPYLATVSDSYEIAKTWSEFVPKVHKQYPHLLAEMFAYSLAAAHLNLKFQLINSLMISDTHADNGEGWELIDQLPVDKVCSIARDADSTQYHFPQVVHMCQRYCLGKEWFFGKRRIPHDVFDCANPLYEEPPDDVATMYDYKWPPDAKTKTELTPKIAKREAFMICHLTRTINEAAEYYKRSACVGGNRANLIKRIKVADHFKK